MAYQILYQRENRSGRTSPEVSVFTDEFVYSSYAFPRCGFLLRRHEIQNTDFAFVKVRVFHEEYVGVKKDDYAVTKNTMASNYDLQRIECVNVCILQSGVDGSLTAKDKDILRHYKTWHSTEAVIFVIYGDIPDKQYHTVSKQIKDQLELPGEFNDVLHRLFRHETDGIAIRISMLLEKQMNASIESLMIDINVTKSKKQNERDLQYHQLKNVSQRNEMICEFGYENGTLFVSIEKYEQRSEVKRYLFEFFQKANSVKIIKFTEMKIKNLTLKSGDKARINENDGTVGVFLKNQNHLFSATCKHVVEDGLGHTIRTGNSPFHINVIIADMELETDRILTPYNNLDFSAIRLVRQNIPITFGLKNQFARYVDGTVFAADMMLPHDAHVYKWGAASNLTNGTFRGIREIRNRPARVEIQCDGITDFALPGDSGSLICYSEAGYEFAAFVLQGCSSDD